MKTNNNTKPADNQTACCFYRVSTEKQDNERQRQDVQRFCDAYNYNIIAEFEEIISGASKLSERKELQALLKFVEENKPKFVVISELSRLARSQDSLVIIEKWTKMGVCLISLKENIRTLDNDGKTNPMTQLLLGILQAVNIFELETVKFRTRSGLQKTVNQGTWCGAAPFGYDRIGEKETSRLVVNDEAETVRYMFQKYSEGWGTHRIASELNRQGKTTKEGAFWRETKVAKLLTYTIYNGVRQYAGQEFEMPELKIVDDSTFTAVREKLSSKANTTPINRQRKNDYLLSAKVVCACGTHMIGQARHDIYMCKSKKYGKGCNTRSISLSWLDEQVKRYLLKNASELIYNKTKLQSKAGEIKSEIEHIEEQLKAEKALQNRLINQLDRIGETKFNQKFDASVTLQKQLEKRLNELQVKLSNTNQNLDKIRPAMLYGGYDLVDSVSVDEFYKIDKELVQTIIEKVDVDNEKAEVQLVDGSTFTIERKQKKVA